MATPTVADPVKVEETAEEMKNGVNVASGSKCPYKLWDEVTVFEGRWLRTKQIRFRTAKGEEGVWQSSHRVTRPAGAEVDGVDILAVMHKQGKKYFILVKQYRIPMRSFCLEFPAGLIDKGETVTQAALRELKEETGYVAKGIVHQSRGVQGLDPGLTDDSCQFVTVEVDGDAPENANPQQHLDPSEAIEVVLVECDKLLQYIKEVEQGVHVEAMLYSFALGYAMKSLVP